MDEHLSIWGDLQRVPHTVQFLPVKVPNVGTVRTRVLRAGTGPELVLLHGTAGHLEAYARNIGPLAEHFTVTAYDMVGHGWSDLPDLPYTTDVLSQHLLATMDYLAIERANLSGESLGGWVAAWTAAHHPDRVDSLVLNTPGNITNKPEVMERLSASTRAAVHEPTDEAIRARVEWLFHRTDLVTDELVELRRAVYTRPGFTRAVENILALQDPQIRRNFAWDPSWVRQIVAPTLLLWTDHDPTGSLDEAELLQSWMSQAKLQVIEGAGHWPQWEKPAEFLHAHVAFIARTGEASA